MGSKEGNKSIVVIEVFGGVATPTVIPEGVEVIVRDYDIPQDGYDEMENIKIDREGVAYAEITHG